MSSPSAPSEPRRARAHWWGFGLYLVVLAAHLVTLMVGPASLVSPTKLAIMPALALAVVIAVVPALAPTSDARTAPTIRRARRAAALLLLALAFSWLGDGAGLFFPFFGAELPPMLICFGFAHLLYIALFTRGLRDTRPRRAGDTGAGDAAPARRRLPRWTLVYAVWWIVMIVLLWPHLGALAVGVAVYGLVLAGTAAAAALGSRATALGGLLFLASDTLLALRLFLPGADAVIGDVAVMSTYGLGQGLLAAGTVALLRARRPHALADSDAITDAPRETSGAA